MATKRDKYKVHDATQISKALLAIEEGMSLRQASEHFKIKKSTLSDKKNLIHKKTRGGKKLLTDAEEQLITAERNKKKETTKRKLELSFQRGRGKSKGRGRGRGATAMNVCVDVGRMHERKESMESNMSLHDSDSDLSLEELVGSSDKSYEDFILRDESQYACDKFVAVKVQNLGHSGKGRKKVTYEVYFASILSVVEKEFEVEFLKENKSHPNLYYFPNENKDISFVPASDILLLVNDGIPQMTTINSRSFGLLIPKMAKDMAMEAFDRN